MNPTPPFHWAAALIGLPWAPGAQGPDAFDCRGLVRYVVRSRLGVELPDVEDAHGSPWRPAVALPPAEHDVVLMQGPDGRHIGILVRSSRLLGVLHSAGTIDRRTGRPVGGVVFQSLADATADGYHRHERWRHFA